MTRGEINSNIRYNENLVRSYQRTIQNLNDQIRELNTLKLNIQSYQREFANKERNRKNRLLQGAVGVNFKFVDSYVTAMINLMTGIEYQRAYNGLTEAVQRIDGELRRLSGEIITNNKQLLYRRNRITYWKNQRKYVK